MSGTKISEVEQSVISCAEMYGPAVDFGGAGAKLASRNAAKRMIEIGFLSGQYRNCRITSAGREALEAQPCRTSQFGETAK